MPVAVTLGFALIAASGATALLVWIVSLVQERRRYAPLPPQPSPPLALPAEASTPQWALALGVPDDDPLDAEIRLDMVDRLAFLGQPWCEDTLRAASHEEADPRVGEAIAVALRQQ